MIKGKTARSRAWNFPTSPRSPYKLQGELKLLKAFDGRVWDKNTQLEFSEGEQMRIMSESELEEENKRKNYYTVK
jgi:hypothetical protein